MGRSVTDSTALPVQLLNTLPHIARQGELFPSFTTYGALTVVLQYIYTDYSPPPHSFYPTLLPVFDVNPYDHDGHLRPFPAGYVNHYVGLHSSVRWLLQRRPSVVMEWTSNVCLLIGRFPHEPIHFSYEVPLESVHPMQLATDTPLQRSQPAAQPVILLPSAIMTQQEAKRKRMKEEFKAWFAPVFFI